MLLKNILIVNKPRTKTPLEMVQWLKNTYPNYQDQKITYAGRLDPMAEGLLILLVGEEIKNKQKYLNLDKTYQFKVILGLETDTYDVLGLLKSTQIEPIPDDIDFGIKDIIKETKNLTQMEYPAYSSKTVQGKALFDWAKEDLINQIETPKREIKVYNFKLLNKNEIFVQDLVPEIISDIYEVNGQFRQTEIIKKWQELLTNSANQKHQILEFEIKCSSGTYIRQIANLLGQKLGTGALALEIKRTQIGQFDLSSLTYNTVSYDQNP